MRLIYPVLLFLSFYAHKALAIKFSGYVIDAISGEPVRGVNIVNLNSGLAASADVSGNFSITVRAGDSLSCSVLGYAGVIITVLSDEPDQYRRISLNRKVVNIDTVVVRSLTQYQQDSLERRAVYGKKVDQQPAKFRLAKKHPLYGGAGSGILNFDAPISSVIQKWSKKYKRLKAFQDRFKSDENQAYINSRYTPLLVTGLTGLTGDSLSLFMKTFPVAYDFSRAATELEFKMWVKYNYRTWISSGSATLRKE